MYYVILIAIVLDLFKMGLFVCAFMCVCLMFLIFLLLRLGGR